MEKKKVLFNGEFMVLTELFNIKKVNCSLQDTKVPLAKKAY